jgi:hypothetical protein
MVTDDDVPPTSPAESLRLIEQERAEIERRLTPDPRFMLWPWGFAWLIGFTLFFLRYGPGGHIYVNLPGWLPLVALLGLIMAAGVVTGVVAARAGRHITGPSSRQGAMYGLTWSVVFAGLSVVLSTTNGMLSDSASNLLWAGTMVAVTGALHMVGGAMWNDRSLFAIGAVISVVNVVGVLVGPGWHSAIVAIGGGGGMLVAGFLGWLRWRR